MRSCTVFMFNVTSNTGKSLSKALIFASKYSSCTAFMFNVTSNTGKSWSKALIFASIYSSNKIKKTQNEHLNTGCQNLKSQYIIVNLMAISCFLGGYTTCFLL